MPDDTSGTSQEPAQQQQADGDQKIANLVNSAVTAHLKRFTDKVLPELLGTHLKPITDKLNAPPPVVEEKPKKGEVNPELAAAQRQLEEAKQTIQNLTTQHTETLTRTRTDKAFTDVGSGLEGKVRPELRDTVIKVFKADGRVVFAEDGTPLFVTGRKDMFGEDEKLPLADGVADWLRSDAAKPFLPAPAGAGAQPLQQKRQQFTPPTVQRGQPVDPSKMTPAQKNQAALEAEHRALAALGRR